MTHRLRVNLSEIEDALESASYEQIYVLDLETGQVLWTAADESGEVDEIYEQIEGVGDDDGAAFEAALERGGLPEWRKESLRQAARIKSDFGTRYRPIEPQDPHADYRDMEAFIEPVGDAALARHLERAIRGRGAFRYFRDVLEDYPEERERWFQFKSDRLRERALEWLRVEDIELVAE